MPMPHTNFSEAPKGDGILERKKRAQISGPMVELEGNSSIVISGRCVILLYSETEMRVQCGKMTICVRGDSLELNTLDETELAIVGLIAEIAFLTGEG